MPIKQNVLIIGGSSFVARNFIRLQKNNYEIKAVYRTKSKNENELLISNFEKIPTEWFQNMDVVINCAAIVHQSKKVANEIYTKINFKLAIDIAIKAKDAGVKTFIQLSTISVYGNTSHISENCAEHSANAYGQSKLLADNQLRKMTNDNFKVVIFRPPMIYGSSDAPGNMMRLIKLISKGFPLPFKKITNKRDFIHIDNLVGFIDAAIKKNIAGTYLVSDHSPVYISELYAIIIQCLGKTNRAFSLPEICFKTIKKMVPEIYDKLFGNLTIDCTSTINILDFKPKELLKEGIIGMIAGIRNKELNTK